MYTYTQRDKHYKWENTICQPYTFTFYLINHVSGLPPSLSACSFTLFTAITSAIFGPLCLGWCDDGRKPCLLTQRKRNTVVQGRQGGSQIYKTGRWENYVAAISTLELSLFVNKCVTGPTEAHCLYYWTETKNSNYISTQDQSLFLHWWRKNTQSTFLFTQDYGYFLYILAIYHKCVLIHYPRHLSN